MTESNNVYENHAAALRIFIRAGQDLERACEKTCSSHLTTVKQLREELSGSEKKLAEANVQINRLEEELAQVRGELTADKQTLRDNGVTIARLEATVIAQERTIGHADLLRQRDDLWEKLQVWRRDLDKVEEENRKMRTELEQRRSSDCKRALTKADADTAETDPKRARTGADADIS
jgi:chromosome segregation ATPase